MIGYKSIFYDSYHNSNILPFTLMMFFNAAQPGAGRVQVLGSKKVQQTAFSWLQALKLLGFLAFSKRAVGPSQGLNPGGGGTRAS